MNLKNAGFENTGADRREALKQVAEGKMFYDRSGKCICFDVKYFYTGEYSTIGEALLHVAEWQVECDYWDMHNTPETKVLCWIGTCQEYMDAKNAAAYVYYDENEDTFFRESGTRYPFAEPVKPEELG